MSLATTGNIRRLGRLPDEDKLPNSEITVQLDSACRELTRKIGEYSSSSGTKLDDCIEAEGCLCMIRLLPVLNTFYTQGMSTAQKEVGEMDFVFHSPDEIVTIQQYWNDRADSAMQPYLTAEAETDSIRWYAI